MTFNKIKLVAQAIGFLCVGLLAVYGGVVAATGAPPAWAGGPGAAPGAPSGITPQLISYQGTLRDADDNPADGTYNMVVGIFDNAGATDELLWSETHNSVVVREGHFNLLLGESNAIPAHIFASPERYIQLTVDGVPMTPTQRFAAVPYAIAATYATQLSAPDGDPADAVTVDNNGNVGIGTSTPGQTLELLRDNADVGIRFHDPYDAWFSMGIDRDDRGSFKINRGGQIGANPDFVLRNDTGRVGIGTTDPGAKLDVNGNAHVSGNVGIGTTTPRGHFDVDGAGDIWLTDDGLQSGGQTLYLPGHIYMAPYGNGNVAYLQARRSDNSGTTALQLRTYNNGTLKNAVHIAGDGDVDVNGTINADGLTIDSHKPIIFQYLRYTKDHSYSNWYSSYSSDQWSCGVVGFWVDGDIQEKGRQTPILKAWAEVDSKKRWVFSFNQSGKPDPEDEVTLEFFEALIMCVDNDLVEWKTDWLF